MEKGKTTRYFKYAIGEIVLVVIGILIALQINNWNQEKNQRNSLHTYLNTLKEELNGNINRLNTTAERSERDLTRTVDIIRIFNSDSAQYMTSDDIYKVEINTGPVFKVELYSAVYKDLINSGVLESMKNPELKRDIFQIERHFEQYDETFNNAKQIWDDYLLPYYHKHKNVSGLWDSIEQVSMPKLPFSNDTSAFIYNRDYSNLLASRARQIANLNVTSMNIKAKFESLNDAIDHFLEHD